MFNFEYTIKLTLQHSYNELMAITSEFKPVILVLNDKFITRMSRL